MNIHFQYNISGSEKDFKQNVRKIFIEFMDRCLAKNVASKNHLYGKYVKKNEKKCQQLIKNKIVKRIPLIDLIEKTKSYP